MTRKYDASRRRQAAARTHKDIVEAALKLHWQGVTEFSLLAREAGCSLATLRKHFPTKEALFRDCTRTFGETLTMPDLAALAAISGADRRLVESVSELCRIHEAMFGYAWLCAHLRDQSPVLDAEMTAYEGLAGAVGGILVAADSPRAAVIRGFLDFLTYRALRLSGELSPERAREELIATLRPLIPTGEASPSTTKET